MSFVPVFLDLETTGLDPERGVILEVGLLALEPGSLQERAAWSCPVNPPSGWQGLCDDRVLEMHRASGLLELLSGPASYLRLEAGGLPRLELAEEWALAFVAQQILTDKPALCGFDPDFDRRWLRRHMPRLHDAFSHSNLDCNAFWLADQAAFGAGNGPKPAAAHRALPDCRAAAEVLRAQVALRRAAARVG